MTTETERKTYTVDVANKSLGRVATQIAVILMGKNEKNYRPHEDKGGFVLVKNIDKIKVTGRKKEDKIYYHHSGYLGGLKEVPYRKIVERDPGEPLRIAVYGMLPKNRLRKERIKRLKFE
jgi:large subunit ribosomal protein L13